MKKLKKWLLPFLVFYLYRTWSWTWRVKIFESPELKEKLKNRDPILFAHWHGDELALAFLIPRYKLATMTSLSADGQLMEAIIKKLGGTSSKGSSSRGAISALKGLINLMKQGHPVSIAVDGPRGPIHKPKPGIFELSKIAKAPIFPASAVCSHPYFFPRSWNKTFLPLPFSKVCFYIDSPSLGLTAGNEDPRSKILATKLAEDLHCCQKKAFEFLYTTNP